MSETAKNKYIKDRQYLIDASDDPDKKKESLEMQFDRRVEQGKIIVSNGDYTLRKLTKEEQKDADATSLAKGGLAEATAKLKAKEFSEGGTVIKTKTVAIDKSPNSGLITQRGFGASRRT